MRRKVLSVVLCVCMMMTMAPFAFATENTDTTTPVEVWTGYSGTKVSAYASLQEAVENRGVNKYIAITSDYTLDTNFTIPDQVLVDVREGATLTIADGVTLTVPAKANRLGVLDGSTVQGKGSVMLYGRGSSVSVAESKVMISGTMNKDMIQVPDGYFLDKNGNRYFACNTPLYEFTFADGTTRLSSNSASVNDEASKITQVKLLNNIVCNGWSLKGSAEGCILDLNGYKLENSSAPTSATCVIHIYTPFIIKNGTIQYNGNGYNTRDKTAGAVETSADVVIESDVTIDGGQSYGIWTEGYGHTLTVNGTVKSSTGAYAITGNGEKSGNLIDDCNIIVNDGATITATNGIGIYHSELGTVTINGGSISGNTGVQMCAGKLIVNDGHITSTGDNQNATGSQNAILDGGAVSIINRNYPGGIPSAEIKGGFLMASGTNALAVKAYDYKNNKVAAWTDAAKYVRISGGYFTTDPSAYCVPGKKVFTLSEGNYHYMVGSLPENSENKINEATAAGQTRSSVSNDVANNDKANANSTASSVTPANLPTENITISKDDKQAAVTELAKKSKLNVDENGKIIDGKTVTVIKQPYLDVTVESYSINEDSTSTVAMNITPKYNLVAVATAEGQTPEVQNGYPIVTGHEMTVTEPTKVTITLPSVFAKKKVYIAHTLKSGEVRYYIVTAEENGNITFTTDGFSPFTFTTETPNAVVAEIGNTPYTALQDAVDAVQNGETINVTGTGLSAIVSGNKSFTVTGNSVTLTAASGYNLTNNGNVYTVSRHHSSSSTTTSYNVNVTAATNGTVAADKKTAAKGATVTVTATPSAGYVVEAVKVTDKDGKDVAVTVKDGKYVFTMPGSAVTVTGSFKAETPAESGLPFVDVKNGDWFYDAVKYAYENGLMTGTSATTFAPNGTMNRAMIVTVLYRLEKSPAVTAAAKFTDVPAGQWYSDAVAWAAANGIVNGYDETTFGPMNAVTREQLAAILFRYEQSKGLENVTLEENLNRFPDKDKISAYAVPALQWAVGQKVINGNADGTLDPTGTATRAQVAQILMNLLQ